MDSARSVDTSTRERVRVARLFPLPSTLSRDHPLSTFFVSHLSCPPPNLAASLRARYLRAKDVCFVNQQSWLKLPLARRDGRQGRKGRRRKRERRGEWDGGDMNR